jgi:hypothetical protein
MSQVQQVVCCYSCHTFQGESPSGTQVYFVNFCYRTFRHITDLNNLICFLMPLTVVNENINIFSANCQEEQQQVAVQDLPGETEHQEGLLLWAGC